MHIKLILFLFFVFFTSCSKNYDTSNSSVFRYNESSGIATLDPAFAKDQARIWACNQIFNGLVQFDNNLKVTPSIAKYWTISKDGLVYKFYLRTDVKFHKHSLITNDRRVLASDFCYSFDRLRDKSLASPGAWIFYNIDYYDAYNDSTFLIKLKEAFPPFLGLLTMQYCSVVPREIVENRTFREEPIGTGPFRFQYWKEGVKLVLRKNLDYFESGLKDSLPFLDAIAITFIKDKQTAFLEFIKGNLDFISGLDISYKDEILTRNGDLRSKYKKSINFDSSPYLNTEYLGFLMEDTLSPVSNLLVRKAINYGFDRRRMLKYLRNNIGTPACHGFIPEGMPSFSEDLDGYEYNPEKAKKLLQEVILNNGEDFKNVTLHTTSSYLDLCEYIQYQLNQIGFNINIEVNPPATHRQMVATSKLSFFRGSWIADYADAENYLALFYSKNFSPEGPNYTHFNNKDYDLLYEKASHEPDDSIRYKLYAIMDEMIIQEAPIVPLYYDRVIRFYQSNISGLDNNPMNLLNLKRVIKD